VQYSYNGSVSSERLIGTHMALSNAAVYSKP